jgi:hypothetical protein
MRDTVADKLREELAKERSRRVYYQGVVYDVCNIVDKMLGRSARDGTCTQSGTVDSPSRGTQEAVKLVCDRLEELYVAIESAAGIVKGSD